MQNTTQAWKEIVATEGHYFETRVIVNGNTITSEQIREVTRDRPGMESQRPSIGGAMISTLRLIIYKPDFAIPKQAEIKVQTRARVNNRISGWLAQGTYFIDTRVLHEGDIELLEITAVDSMAKAEADYPDTSHAWPHLDKSVVAEIAAAMGVTVDPRTNTLMTARYMIDLPASYTMRETLGHIASMYCGNFIMTAENKLLLVPLYGLDAVDGGFYLADENGNALVFGNEGWYILV